MLNPVNTKAEDSIRTKKVKQNAPIR